MDDLRSNGLWIMVSRRRWKIAEVAHLRTRLSLSCGALGYVVTVQSDCLSSSVVGTQSKLRTQSSIVGQ